MNLNTELLDIYFCVCDTLKKISDMMSVLYLLYKTVQIQKRHEHYIMNYNQTLKEDPRFDDSDSFTTHNCVHT